MAMTSLPLWKSVPSKAQHDGFEDVADDEDSTIELVGFIVRSGAGGKE
jgi:hypothetical protein